MANSKYRRAMFKAFTFPVALFVVFPFTVAVWVGPFEIGRVVHGIATLATIVAPIYATGFFLAPWAGRCVVRSKAPAFVMAAASAAASPLFVFVLGSLAASASVSFGALFFFAFFAVPTSPLAALFFIGACEQLGPGRGTGTGRAAA